MSSIEGWIVLFAGLVIGAMLATNKILQSPWWVRFPILGLCLSMVAHGATHLVAFKSVAEPATEAAIAVSLIFICLAFRNLRISEKLRNRELTHKEALQVRRVLARSDCPAPVPGSIQLADGALFFHLPCGRREALRAITTLRVAGLDTYVGCAKLTPMNDGMTMAVRIDLPDPTKKLFE